VDYQFKEGDKVPQRNMKQKARKGSKGEDRWLGLYTIVELSATTCILKNAPGKKLKTRINLSQLKPYLQASQSDNKYADPSESDNELTSQSEPDEPSDNESENETKADPAEDDLPDSEPNQPDPRCKCKTRSTRKCPCRAQKHACAMDIFVTPAELVPTHVMLMNPRNLSISPKQNYKPNQVTTYG